LIKLIRGEIVVVGAGNKQKNLKSKFSGEEL
jgi:hypothetical protein